MTNLGLVITDGVGYRNFILSDFLTVAQAEFDEVVIFSYLPREAFRGFDHKIIELKALEESFFTWFFRKAKEIAHLKRNRRDNHGIQDNLKTNYNKNWSSRGIATRLIYGLTHIFHSETAIDIFQRAQFQSCKNNRVAKNTIKALGANNCDLLFFTHQRPPFVIPLVAAAQQMNLPTAAFIFSWDNLASKGRMASNFDHYLVWSNQMKADLLKFYSKVDPNQISVVGTPQFAPYAMDQYDLSKQEFKAKFELNTELRTLCFSCGDVSTSPNDPYYIEEIARAIEQELIPKCNLLIRSSPAETAERFEKLRHDFPWIEWNEPQWNQLRSGHQEAWSQRIPSKEDLMDLKAILRFSDVNINMLSTMSLDFMLHQKPVVNPVMGSGSNGLGDDQKFLKYAHIKLLIDSGATQVAMDVAEMIQCINNALETGPDLKAQSVFIDQQIGVSIDKTTVITAQALKQLLH